MVEAKADIPRSLEDGLQHMRAALQARRLERKRERKQQNRERSAGSWVPRFTQMVEHLSGFISQYGWPAVADLPMLREVENPYLPFWAAYDGSRGDWRYPEPVPPGFSDAKKLSDLMGLPPHSIILADLGRRKAREFATLFFGFAVPTEPALQAIADLDRPIVEVGAGRAYWAHLLRKRGVRVEAYEPAEWGWSWAETVRRMPDQWRRTPALMFCWPSYDEPWPASYLRRYKGDTVIYIGEGDGGCTGDDRFHRLLDRYYETAAHVNIPQWDGIHDVLTIWRRK